MSRSCLLVAAAVGWAVLVQPVAALQRGAQGSNPTAATIDRFNKAIEEHMAMHKKLVANLPKLPEDASPEQIDFHQRELGRQIATVRQTAKRGDMFTQEMAAIVRQLLARVFEGPKGQQVRESIFDEPTDPVELAINGRYPDHVPLSTMPPLILKELPKLPKGLEFRFVGDHLILLDVPAHLIIDFVPNAVPKA